MVAQVKDRDVVELVDLPVYGYPTRLVWHKQRLCCLEPTCLKGSWTEQDPRIATMNLQMTNRCRRWVTEQVAVVLTPSVMWRGISAVIGTP